MAVSKVFIRQLIYSCFYAIGFWLLLYFSNVFLSGKDIWNTYFLCRSDSVEFFCEQSNMDAFIRQPINTFTNIIYFMTALYYFRRGLKDIEKKKRYNLVSANPFYSILNGVITLITFATSSFYHSSLTVVGEYLDFSAVFSMTLFPLMYFTHRVMLLTWGLPSNTRHSKGFTWLVVLFSLAYIGLLCTLGWGKINYLILGIIILNVVFAIIVENMDKGRTNKQHLFFMILFITLAIVFYALDEFKAFCYPHSIYQAHALWHIMNGIACFYFYLYIRSEKNFQQ